MSRSGARPRARDIVIVALLVAGLLSGLVLVIVGGGSSEPSAPEGGEATAGTVPSEDVSLAAVERWSGLDVPDSAQDFLTARLGGEQLDLTFTMPAADEAAFVSGSGLPEPVPGERVIMHSSPLWQLNPGEEGAGGGEGSASTTVPSGPEDPPPSAVEQPDIRATTGVAGGVLRVVELVEEGEGVVRARVVLAPA